MNLSLFSIDDFAAETKCERENRLEKRCINYHRRKYLSSDLIRFKKGYRHEQKGVEKQTLAMGNVYPQSTNPFSIKPSTANQQKSQTDDSNPEWNREIFNSDLEVFQGESLDECGDALLNSPESSFSSSNSDNSGIKHVLLPFVLLFNRINCNAMCVSLFLSKSQNSGG